MEQINFLKHLNDWIVKFENQKKTVITDSDTNPSERKKCVYLVGGWAINRHFLERETNDIDLFANETLITEFFKDLYFKTNYAIVSNPDTFKDGTQKRTLSINESAFSIETRFFNSSNKVSIGASILNLDWLYENSTIFTERKIGNLPYVRVPSISKLIILKSFSITGRPNDEREKIINDINDIAGLLKSKNKIDTRIIKSDLDLLESQPNYSNCLAELNSNKSAIKKTVGSQTFSELESLLKDLMPNPTNSNIQKKRTTRKTLVKSKRISSADFIKVYPNLEKAKSDIKKSIKNTEEIKILSNKGLEFFGSDSSIVSLADMNKLKNLKTLKILLLSPESQWFDRGVIAQRKYESFEQMIKEMSATQKVVEIGMQKARKEIKLGRDSGIKYQYGEPKFRLILTSDFVYTSSYAEKHSTQVRDLPIYRFSNQFGSMYGALRRHFNDLWVNNSEPSTAMKKEIDFSNSSGGIVIYKEREDIFIALVQREDGSWVLPKGHKKAIDKNFEENAKREISEEITVNRKQLHCIKFLDSYSYDEIAEEYGEVKTNHFFLFEYLSDSKPILKPDVDHSNARWWNTKEELPFLYYSRQKLLIADTLLNEFGTEVKMNPK